MVMPKGSPELKNARKKDHFACKMLYPEMSFKDIR